MADTKAPEAPAPDAATPPTGRHLWSSKSFVLSLALVVALALAATWIVVDDPGPARPAGPQSTGAGAASPSPGGGPGCGPAGGSQVPPATAPDTTWRLLGSMAAPMSEAAGPAEEADGVPLCFAPDPVGALFAAATFVAASSDPELRVAVLEQLAAETDGRRVALDATRETPGTATVGVQIAGFTFLSYRRADSAVIDLALISKGVLVHVPLELAWTGEDWRIVVPVTGRPFDAAQAVPSLAGYVPWQGA